MIKIIAIDKIKDKNLKTEIDIFLTRLNNKLKIEIIEISPAKYHTYDNIELAKIFEANKILSYVNPDSFVFVLDEQGKQFSSIDFSKQIESILNHKHIIFIIGGAYGLSQDIKKRADTLISFSKMTFTHEMIRLFLTEQLYRAYTINNNIKYHN